MPRSLMIDGFQINDDSDCFVIAEVGHNHQGSMEQAKELFLAAKECEANAVKLQKRDNRSLYTKQLFDQAYDHRHSFGKTYGEHREYLEFNKQEYEELISFAKEIGITFFSTAFDFQSADFLEELDMPAYKIASGDIINTPLLKHIAGFNKPMIVSTGGATIEDVQRAYDTLMPINHKLCIMQCTSGYPCSFEEMDLRVIPTYREMFPEVVIGLSAHDNGIAMALVGYSLGARVIEKHFTLNRAMKGSDHAFSLERPGMRRLVRDLKRARLALGSSEKRVFPSEQAPLYKMRKKIVAARGINKGHVLTMEDIAFKSPDDGLPPFEVDNVIGKKVIRDLKIDENITFDLLEN